ncbi:hypothetical protein DQ384_11970 [Sphaerisporangium album]|uniref:Uncharacterized protein n=1 Tax=Sphaerisporangium album TaxID=509200 RepID=A0A367FLZ4_9ACTN|nr:hypothetical protein [Sphaerisporangium album]RCG31416.1 hypothetical protein DQ384_11970 [Sphaerisporangium album]
MNFCLSDLVPPLRWSDATGFPQLRDQPGLPDAWWRSVPMSRVFVVLGPEALGDLLTELALEHWPAAAVGDVLPALHVMDPDEPDDPQVSIALDRVGSWFGLLALTGRELADQPFIRARPVLAALFTAVFARLTSADRPDAVTGDQTPSLPQGAPAANGQTPGPQLQSPRVQTPQAGLGERPPARHAEPPAAPALPKLPKRQPAASKSSDPLGLAAARMAEAALEQHAGGARAGASMFTPPPRTERPAPPPPIGPGFGVEPPPPLPAPGFEPPPPLPVPGFEPPPLPAFEPPPAYGPEPLGGFGGEEAGYSPAPRPFVPEPEPFDPGPFGPQPAPAGPQPGAQQGTQPGTEPTPEVAGAEEPAESPEAGSEASHEADAPPAQGDPAEDEAAHPDEAAEAAGTPEGDAAPPQARAGTGTDELAAAEADMISLIDSVFADLDDQTWTVAQIQVFTDEPAAPEELAKLFAVTADDIVEREKDLRDRLAAWLDSPAAAPYTQYLEKLPGALGIAAPKSRLVGAAAWHTRELRSLDIPAWQFVMATLPGYTVQDEWLVAGDIADLRERTCTLILNAERPPTVARALELVSTLGIHPEVAKEWLENVPQLRIQSAKKPESGTPEQQPPAEAAPAAPEQEGPPPSGQLKDVSMTRKCFRHPDGLWWLRIDIGPEQLSGGECPLPSGFAAYLGMSPGDSHTVMSAAGEVTLSWQARPVIDSLGPLLDELEAEPGSCLFVTIAEEDQVLRAGLVPPPPADADKNTQALRLAGYTVTGAPESLEETIRVLATRIGMTGPVGLPDLMNRLRERGDRDLLSLMV